MKRNNFKWENIKDYSIENGEYVDAKKLKAELVPKEIYKEAHKGIVISCHDVFIEYNGGILLVSRKKLPMKNTPWPIGGRIARGFSTEESLKRKVIEECGLSIEELKYLGTSRTMFTTDPFEHGRGTDTLNVIYFAKGKGEIKLNEDHENPMIIKPSDYTKEFKEKLHPYVNEFLEKSFEML